MMMMIPSHITAPISCSIFLLALLASRPSRLIVLTKQRTFCNANDDDDNDDDDNDDDDNDDDNNDDDNNNNENSDYSDDIDNI